LVVLIRWVAVDVNTVVVDLGIAGCVFSIGVVAVSAGLYSQRTWRLADAEHLGAANTVAVFVAEEGCGVGAVIVYDAIAVVVDVVATDFAGVGVDVGV
jgi:hypothetical protein